MKGADQGDSDGDTPDESRIQAELAQTTISLASVASEAGHFKPRVPSAATSAASTLSGGLLGSWSSSEPGLALLV